MDTQISHKQSIQALVQVMHNDMRDIDDYSSALGCEHFFGNNLFDLIVDAVVEKKGRVAILDAMCGCGYAWVSFFERLRERYDSDSGLQKIFHDYTTLKSMFLIEGIDIRSKEDMKRALTVRKGSCCSLFGRIENLDGALFGLDILGRGVGFQQADVEHYTPNRSYDLVLCVDGLQYAENMFGTLERLHNLVLEDNGVMIANGILSEHNTVNTSSLDIKQLIEGMQTRGYSIASKFVFDQRNNEESNAICVRKVGKELDFGLQLIEKKQHPTKGYYYRFYQFNH